jgi:hypothetical protein
MATSQCTWQGAVAVRGADGVPEAAVICGAARECNGAASAWTTTEMEAYLICSYCI